MCADLLVDLGAQPLPTVQIRLFTETFHIFHEPIHRDPGHHFGMGKLPPRPAHFPYAFIRVFPPGFKKVEQMPLQRPG